MCTYYLRPSIYFCELSEGVVFLDIDSHAYMTVPPSHLQVLRRIVHGWPDRMSGKPRIDPQASEGSNDFVDALLKRGVLTESASQGKIATVPVIASEDSIAGAPRKEEGLASARIGEIAAYFLSLYSVMIRLRFKRTRVLFHRIKQAKLTMEGQRVVPGTYGDTRRLVAIFRRLSVWTFTRRDRCLLDSIALITFLHRRAIPATLIIGVSTKPFTAHAWVQLGEIVLNDTTETVSKYTPLLVL